MIVVDTSALMAIILDEPEADACTTALTGGEPLAISAGTLTECLIVAAGRNVQAQMDRLLDGLGLQVVNVTPASARRAAAAYRHWGRGVHPAALNFGDCFAYAEAKENGCRLLYAGNDFAKTDIESAL